MRTWILALAPERGFIFHGLRLRRQPGVAPKEQSTAQRVGKTIHKKDTITALIVTYIT